MAAYATKIRVAGVADALSKHAGQHELREAWRRAYSRTSARVNTKSHRRFRPFKLPCIFSRRGFWQIWLFGTDNPPAELKWRGRWCLGCSRLPWSGCESENASQIALMVDK